MKLSSFSAIPENNEELHLPELVYWSSLGEVEQVKLLLEQGVDVNSIDEEGYSALQAAAENNYIEIVQLLLEHGADKALKGQYTALELAEMAGNKDIVLYLKAY
ncbi:ankyrin repeat domain-containing protein [Acinetobacter rudis]|uniref:Ankyrin repeat domain-containing protein n=1 Tax=Acinetobacter rudis TaxID=632955 RepID=A0AAW8J881_9GAMM|nr:ankyrin repeat domain-containing protein [Acinetobacter rudis]MDQ8935960.1 ankyrin repeat domain-containing protein [Acinetobacter rudis]MDQ9018223.1 ankyrin repeat domain-containing protein [Acinetobacter rudis]